MLVIFEKSIRLSPEWLNVLSGCFHRLVAEGAGLRALQGRGPRTAWPDIEFQRNCRTGSPEAVARPRFPQNVACGFPAPTLFGSCFTALRCYLFKFRFHGQLIFSLNRRPCLPLNGAHVAQEQFNYR